MKLRLDIHHEDKHDEDENFYDEVKHDQENHDEDDYDENALWEKLAVIIITSKIFFLTFFFPLLFPSFSFLQSLFPIP